MSALPLDAGEVSAGAVAAWQALFVRLARFCISDDHGAPPEEPVTVDNYTAFAPREGPQFAILRLRVDGGAVSVEG